MAPIAAPLVNGHPVRFFEAPSGLGLPRHAFLDLLVAMGMTPKGELEMMRLIRSGPYRGETQRLATPDGPVVVASHRLAQGVIGWTQKRGLARPGFDQAYGAAMAQVVDVLTEGDPLAKLGLVAGEMLAESTTSAPARAGSHS